jgi:hypothetical protein
MESEHIQRIKNSKRGHLSTVTSRKNEITDLISDDTNLKLVNEKLQNLSQSFIKYSEVDQAYQDCETLLKARLQNKTNMKQKNYCTAISRLELMNGFLK